MVLKELIRKGIDTMLDAIEPYYVNYHQLQPIASQYELGLPTQYKKVEEIRPHQYSQTIFEDGIFDDIVGHDDLKAVIIKCIKSEEPINVLLYGPPATAKTLFLLAIYRGLGNCYFTDGSNASGAGMVEYLFAHKETQIIAIDELDKLKKSDQTTLLNLLETGILTSTKVRKTAQQKMNIKVFATSNDIDRISKPLRSRFVEFSLPSYTYEEFCEIAVKLMKQRNGHDREIAMKIADIIWNKLNSRDIRDVIQISKLTNSIDDVEFVAKTLQKYAGKRDNEGYE
jgi:replication-associated recombination protein RarA